LCQNCATLLGKKVARIYKRGEFWHVDYFHQGRRTRTSLKTTDKREARRRLKDLLKSPDVPRETPTRKDIPLTALLQEYLVFARAEKRPNVAMNEGYTLKEFLASIPCRTAQQITISHIRNYKVAISGKKPNTIRNRLTAVKVFLKYAKTMGFLSQNPADGIKLPKIPKQAPKYLNVKQLRTLLNALPKRARSIVYFFAKTGLRLSEGLNLRWEDIKGRHIVVRQTKDPGREFRIVPIDDKLKPILDKLPKGREHVFDITHSQLKEDFYKGRKKTGIEWATIHTLRHTFASNLVMNGVGIRTVQELLGHTQIETTMIYAHLSMEHLEGAIKKLPY